MLDWLFRKRAPVVHDPVAPFRYGDDLSLEWDHDSDGWMAALPELGDSARI